MGSHDIALFAAGLIGSGVALVHGVLMQRLMVRPLAPHMAADRAISAAAGRLVPPLLHFSTFNWFLGGLGLIVASIWLHGEARLAICLLVGSSYLYGALLNCWGTRGRHPGWMLYTLATGLIVIGLAGGGAISPA